MAVDPAYIAYIFGMAVRKYLLQDYPDLELDRPVRLIHGKQDQGIP